MVFLYFSFFSTLQINIEDIKIMKEHIWNYVVNKKMLNKPEYVLYFRFFKVATFCFDDSFEHSWHSFNQLHEVVTWNGFPTVLKEFTEVLSTCWLLCLHSVVQLIPDHLNWV